MRLLSFPQAGIGRELGVCSKPLNPIMLAINIIHHTNLTRHILFLCHFISVSRCRLEARYGVHICDPGTGHRETELLQV